ncbi:aspartyl protease [Nostoc calcicola FACHB-389]|nr:aspartyl protease [Nostoc calcicola FACHB-3891]OKH37475.1 aspartyl protease [Nostoc calcicola FACHB-389]
MIQGEFDEIGQLFFEIELVAGNGETLPVTALLDTGSTEWLAINNQDLEVLEWLNVGTRDVVTGKGEVTFNIYLGKVVLDAQEFTVQAVAGSEFREIILGLPWLRTRRLVVDFPAGVLTLG